MTQENDSEKPLKKRKGRFLSLLLAAVIIIGAVSIGGVNYYSNRLAAELDSTAKLQLRRTGLNRVLSYSKVSVDPIRRAASFHDVEIEYEDQRIAEIGLVRVTNYNDESGVPYSIQLELSGVRGELLEQALIEILVQNSYYGDVEVEPLLVIAALQPELENGSISIGYFLDRTEGSFSLNTSVELDNVLAVQLELTLSEAGDVFLDLFELLADLDRNLIQNPSLEALAGLSGLETTIRSAQRIGLQSFSITVEDQGYVRAWEEILSYQLGGYGENFDISEELLGGRDDRFTDAVAELEDVIGREGLEVVRAAVEPGGRLIIESNFRRPVELIDLRYGEIAPHEDLQAAETWLEDGLVVLRN